MYVIDLLGFNSLQGSKEFVPPSAREPSLLWFRSRHEVKFQMFQVGGLENFRPVSLSRAVGSYREKRNLNYEIHTHDRSNDGPPGIWTFAGIARAP